MRALVFIITFKLNPSDFANLKVRAFVSCERKDPRRSTCLNSPEPATLPGNVAGSGEFKKVDRRGSLRSQLTKARTFKFAKSLGFNLNVIMKTRARIIPITEGLLN